MSRMMTPENASALRKPFDKATVGKLPKPLSSNAQKGKCNECGGYHGLPAVHLDYVGHAATTDRLLSVDPEWNYQIVTVDDSGNPLPVVGKALWIKLTVCGVTRYGYGDGSSIKECIGDAIRNAAMRFGVALDLWSKEELEQAHGPAAPAEPPAVVRGDKPTPGKPIPDKAVSASQVKMMGALMGKLGMTDRDLALQFVADVVGRDVASRNDLTSREASAVIDALQKDIGQPVPPAEDGEPA